jgi:dihydroflavonol-4-reductase
MQLVTGATGHLGNVLVRQLLARGEKIRALVRTGKLPLAIRDLEIEQIPGDLLDPGSLDRAMQGVDVVYHLAARISLTPGQDPETESVNLDGTRNMLAAAARARVRRFIYASSIYALRPPMAGMVDESLPFDPAAARGAYDRSKAAASLSVLQAVEQGMDAVLVCPTAITGPFDFQRSETGRGILYNIQPGIKFTVDGAYDFVDVRDAARGFIQAAARGRRGEAYILGGDRMTVREVAMVIWQATGGWHVGVHLPDCIADLAAEFLPFFSDDPIVTSYSLAAIRSNSVISHAKATSELDFQPRPARQAILDAVHWWQEQRLGRQALPETSINAVS